MTRERVAAVLASCLAGAVVLLTVGVYVQAWRTESGLNDTALALLLLIEGALSGIVGGYLSQSAREHGRTVVGAILAGTLGATLVVVGAFVLADAVWSSAPAISANTAKVLAALFGGTIGALMGYMGIARASERKPPTMTTQTPEPDEPRDPATDPNRDLRTQPQDPDAGVIRPDSDDEEDRR